MARRFLAPGHRLLGIIPASAVSDMRISLVRYELYKTLTEPSPLRDFPAPQFPRHWRSCHLGLLAFRTPCWTGGGRSTGHKKGTLRSPSRRASTHISRLRHFPLVLRSDALPIHESLGHPSPGRDRSQASPADHSPHRGAPDQNPSLAAHPVCQGREC